MSLTNGLRALLALACLLLVGELTFAACRYDDWLGTNDFIEYWSAGQLLLRRANPYDFTALHELQKAVGRVESMPIIMWNPPWLLVLFYPLLMFPFRVAETLWFGLSLAVLLSSTLLIWRLFVPLTSPTRLLVPLLATVIFAPALFTLRMGQVSVLVLLGIAGFLHFERKGRDLWAGAFLVLLTFKPHVTYLLWIAVAWWVVSRGRWRVVWGLGGALLVLCGLLTPLRPMWALDYLSALRHPPLYWRTPVLGTVLRLFFGWNRAWLQYLPSLLLSLLLLFTLHRRRRPFVWSEAASPLLLLSVPTAAYGWSFDQLALLVPYLQAVAWLRQYHTGHPIRSLIIAMGLIASSAMTLWCNASLRDDIYLLWAPLVWGVLYLVAQWALGGRWVGAALTACGEEKG